MTKLYMLTIISFLFAFQLGTGPHLLQQTIPTDTLTQQKEVVNQGQIEASDKTAVDQTEKEVDTEEDESWQLVIDLKNWKLELKKKKLKKK